MMRLVFIASGFAFALGAAGCGRPGPWPDPSAPETVMGSERSFAKLMSRFAESRARHPPWVGSWWPYTDNGVAARSGGGFLKPAAKSPAEKYDRARGGRTRAADWERSHHGRGVPGVEGWWGHCNGWSTAAALFPEPRQPRAVDGVEFSIADQKALLTEAAMESRADFFGDRVDTVADLSSPKYTDPAPNQFFLVLTHYFGRLGMPVLLDRNTGTQVWNQPLAGYRFDPVRSDDYLGVRADAPEVHRVRASVTIWWARDDVAPDSLTLPFDFTDNGSFQSRKLTMELWLDDDGDVILTHDADGRAIGGAWLMGESPRSDAWPDYLWVPHDVTPPTDYGNPELSLAWLKEKRIAARRSP